MQTSQKLEITTPANENQANFPQKHPKIKPRVYPRKHSLGILPGAFLSLLPVQASLFLCRGPYVLEFTPDNYSLDFLHGGLPSV